MLSATDGRGYAANCPAVRDADLRERVRDIQLPTLVIAGSGDLPTRRATASTGQGDPGARYVELEAAHISNLQQVEPFTRTVLEFLQG